MADGIGSMVFEQDLAADGFGNDQVNDIFGDDDDLFNAPAPLPPLSPSHIDGGGNDVDGAGDGPDDKDGKKKKKIIKRSPQPRLNEARLCAERGIPALAHLCDDIKFKGKGHEASDLKVLLQRFEHWAHRLYPKYPFEDVIEQVETLGKKKLVQNSIKQVRRGDDGKVDEHVSDEEMQVNGQDSASNVASTTSMNNAIFGGDIEASSTPVLGLTPEQKERMRLNRERALARRKAPQTTLPIDTTAQTTSQDNTQALSKSPNSPTSLEVGSQKSTKESHNLPSASPERSKLNFETETDTVETETKETEITDKETMETDITDKETMETDEALGKETKETEITDKETMENETMETDITDKEIMETEAMEKGTMETETTVKQTVEKETLGRENMATEAVEKETTDKETETRDKIDVEKETMASEAIETEIMDKETMETETRKNNTVEEETMVTEAIEKETMETEITDKENVEKDIIGKETEVPEPLESNASETKTYKHSVDNEIIKDAEDNQINKMLGKEN